MKTFLKFLPIAAAVLLATSCSKDDNDNAPATQSGSDGVETVTANTIPFSIRVNTGHSLKKVGYAESTNEEEKGWYNISFSDKDVDKLKMKIYIGEITNESNLFTTLTLKNATTGEFTGTVGKPAVDASLTAVITTDGNSLITSSDKSLQDLLATCAHTFLGTFKYGAAEVTLTDQNAYLAITMSPCCDHEIKINTTDYTVKDGRIWVAVPANAPVTSTGLGKELNQKSTEVSPGTIYTVARQYFSVAPGKKVYFSPGNLQYNPKQNQWQFAAHQYDICIKENNDDVSSMYNKDYDGWIDLFGWGTWLNGNDIEPYETQTDDAASYKWSGISAIGSEWETLTCENAQNPGEWIYLLGIDNVGRSQNLCHWATIENVNGLIILPDSFDKEGTNWNEFWGKINWADLEKAGAVFLPASGFRSGTVVLAFGDCGLYWSSSSGGKDGAFNLGFADGRVDGTPNGRFCGQSVRLVRAAL